MRGWVYVMSNQSMPGLVKVGYSSKDPDLRASELNHTGAPHPYLVDYEALVREPYQVEQGAHAILSEHNEGKEWFRCSVEHAIHAIRKAANDNVIHEEFRRIDRLAIESQRQTERLARENARIAVEREAKIRSELERRVDAIRRRHENGMKELIKERPFWQYWLCGVFIALLVLAILAPNIKEVPGFMLTIILGAGIGFIIQSGSSERQRRKPEYIAANQAMELEVKSILEPTVVCSACQTEFSFDPVKVALAGPETTWKCPKCKNRLSPVRLTPL